MTTYYSKGWINCPECDGAGEVEVEHYSRMSATQPYGDIYVTRETCEHCSGNGYVSDPDDEE